MPLTKVFLNPAVKLGGEPRVTLLFSADCFHPFLETIHQDYWV